MRSFVGAAPSCRARLLAAPSRVATVLVTDGEERAALAVVRSLGKAGHTVHVAGRRRRTLASVSRAARASVVAPDPLTNPASFVDTLADYVTGHDIDVVIPITEAALLAILPERERFGRARIPFPPIETVQAVNDKLALRTAAEQVGIAVPEQCVVTSPADVAHLDAASFPYPVVVKPS